MITLADYWMGRDRMFPAEVTPAKIENAKELLRRVNDLLGVALAAGVTLEQHPRTGTLVSSGFRPASINAATPGSAPRSKHMDCLAVDVYDPDGDLDEWCLEHADQLERCALWQEHPAATKGWCHLQSVPPRSGNRVFYP